MALISPCGCFWQCLNCEIQGQFFLPTQFGSASRWVNLRDSTKFSYALLSAFMRRQRQPASSVEESGDNWGMHQYPLIHPCVSRKLTDFSVVLTVFSGCSEKISFVSSTYKKADTIARYVERMLSFEKNS